MIAGLVLAGGRSQRFGGDKALAELDGLSLLDHVLATLGRTCGALAVSARDGSDIGALARARGLPTLPDPPGAPEGPLAGLLAGLVWAQRLGAELLATAPCDTPRLPADLVERLAAMVDERHPAAVARAPDGLHPLCGVWRVNLAAPLAERLSQGRHPPVRQVLAQLGGAEAPFDDAQAFVNVNTREDLLRVSTSLPPLARGR